MSMREFSKISPQIWINERGRQIRSLGVKAQLLAFYLNTNPHASMIGIYYLPIMYIIHETGLSEEDVVTALKSLGEINFCTHDEKSEYIWVHDFAFEQLGSDLKPADKRVKYIHQTFAALPKLPFLNDFLRKYGEAFYMGRVDEKEISPFEGASKGLRSKEKEKEKEKESEKENEQEKEKIKEEEKNNNIIIFSCDEKTNAEPDDNSESEVMTVEQQARYILEFFNKKVGTRYPANDYSLKPIISHLQSGIAYEHFFHVITSKWREWEKNEVMRKFMTIDVIFGPKFTKYLGELHKPKTVGI